MGVPRGAVQMCCFHQMALSRDERKVPREGEIPTYFEYTAMVPNTFSVRVGMGARSRHPELFTDDDFAAPMHLFPRVSAPMNTTVSTYSSMHCLIASDDEDTDDSPSEVYDFLSEPPKGNVSAPWSNASGATTSLAWRQVLRAHLVSAGIAEQDLELFLNELHVARFSCQDVIIKKGSIGDRAFVIVSGSVHVISGSLRTANEVVLASLQAGDHFGFASMIAMQKWAVSLVVSSQEGCVARFIDRFDFAEIAIREPLYLIALHTLLTENVNPELNYACKRSGVVAVPLSADSALAQVTKSDVAVAAVGTVTLDSTTTTASPSAQIALERIAYPTLDDDLEPSPNLLIRRPKVGRGTRGGATTGPEYTIIRPLGSGAHGKVVLCQELPGTSSPSAGCLFAVKIINKIKQRCLSSALSVEAMTCLRHLNICSLVRVIDDLDSGCLYFVQEYCDVGPVMGETLYSKPVEINIARGYFRGIIKGLEYLHAQGIVHRDIKPSNILLKSTLVVEANASSSIVAPMRPRLTIAAPVRSTLLPVVAKIGDFGLSILLPASARAHGSKKLLENIDSTPAFMAPEMFMYDQKPRLVSGTAADLWSLGATLFCMVVGRPPFLETSRERLASLLAQERSAPDYPLALPPLLIDLLKGMLQKDPDSRATLADVFRHPWVTARGTDPLPITIHASVVHSPEMPEAPRSPLPGLQVNSRLTEPSLKAESSEGSTVLHCRDTASLRGEDIELEKADAGLKSPLYLRDVRTVNAAPHSLLLRRHAHCSTLPTREGCLPRSGSSDSAGAFSVESRLSSVAPVTATHVLPLHLTKDDCNVEGLSEPRPEQPPACVPVIGISVGLLGRISHSASAARILVGYNDGDVLTPADMTTPRDDDNGHPCGTAAELGGSASFGTAAHAPKTASAAASLHVLAGQAPDLSQELSEMLNTLSLWEMEPLLPPRVNAALCTAAELDIGVAPSSPLSPQPGASTPRAWWPSRPTQIGIPSDLSVITSSGCAPFLRAGGSSPSGATNEFPTLSVRVVDKLLLQAVARQELGRGAIAAAAEALFDDWTRPPDEDAPEMNWPPDCVSDAPDAGLDIGLLSRSASLARYITTTTTATTNVTTSVRPDSAVSGISDLSTCLVETLEPEDLDAELDMQPSRPLTDPELALLDDLVAEVSLRKRIDSSASQGSPPNSSRGEATIHEELRQLHTLPECTSIPLRLSFGVAELRGIPAAMEDRTLAVIGMEALAAQVQREASIANTGTCVREVPQAHTGLRTSRRQDGSLVNYDASEPQIFFAVYDGHGGPASASALASMLHVNLARQPSFFSDPGVALALAFAETDLIIVREQTAGRGAARSRTVAPESSSDDAPRIGVLERSLMDCSGAVAVVVLCRLEKAQSQPSQSSCSEHDGGRGSTTRLYIANVGDARAVMSRGGIAIDITKDHRAATRPDEVSRIMAAGGWVRNDRVLGVLGVTRAFGDAEFKAGGPSAGIIIAEPTIRSVSVTPLDEFILLASDGIFDVLSSQSAVNFVRRKLHEHGEVQRAALQLAQKALWSGSTDNVSVVIIALNQLPQGEDSER